MKLMIVEDAMLVKGRQHILTGPLLLSGFSSKGDVEKAFGQFVLVVSAGSDKVRVPVKGLSVSQSMSGKWQVSLGVEYPNGLENVALGAFVVSEE